MNVPEVQVSITISSGIELGMQSFILATEFEHTLDWYMTLVTEEILPDIEF